MFIPVSSNLIELAQLFPKPLYIVGGYVRNCLMDINGADIDIAADVDIEDVIKLLKGSPFKAKIKNPKLFSLTITKGSEQYEFTSFRRDFYDNTGSHYPVRVERTSEIIEDAKRRDFTINAIYYDILRDEIYDYYHGVIDAKQRILRCIEDPAIVLRDDGERILRLIRLAGQLNLKVEKKTILVAREMSENIKDISAIRFMSELEKILYSDKRYVVAKSNFNKTLSLLSEIEVFKPFGIKKIKFDMVKKADDRFLGLLIDIICTQKPACMQTYMENFLRDVFNFDDRTLGQIVDILSGYFYALDGLSNKEYFFRFFDDMSQIFPLLEKKSSKIANKYRFFYEYIIRHKIPIRFGDLALSAEEILALYPNLSEVVLVSIQNYLLGKVFDGKLENTKENLINEIKTKIRLI